MFSEKCIDADIAVITDWRSVALGVLVWATRLRRMFPEIAEMFWGVSSKIRISFHSLAASSNPNMTQSESTSEVRHAAHRRSDVTTDKPVPLCPS